jgi:hypothetical protein
VVIPGRMFGPGAGLLMYAGLGRLVSDVEKFLDAIGWPGRPDDGVR